MKRALKKRVTAVLKNTSNSDDAPVEQLNVVNSKANHRARTNFAMIGLAISMGATSLLVTRQSDQAQAAAPVGSQKAASAIPAAPDTEMKFATTKLEAQSVSSASVPANPVIVEPTAISQVPGLEAKLQVAGAKSVQVPASTATVKASLYLHPQAVPSSSVSQPRDVTKLSSASGLSGSQTKSLTNQPAADQAVNSEVNAQLKAQQEFALNRLQEKSNRLRKSLAELRSGETKNLSKVTNESASSTVEETAAQINVSNTATQQLPNVADSKETDPVSSTEQAGVVNSTLTAPKTATLKVANLPNPESYEVKPGDTLAAIASRYGISVSELIRANNLTNPNQLQISQKLIIPAPGVARSIANQSQLATDPIVVQSSITPKLAAPSVNAPSANLNLPMAPQLSVIGDSSTITVPTPIGVNNQLGTNISSGNSYGVGGDTPMPKAYAQIQLQTKPQKVARTKGNERLRSLQAEIERLRNKYRAQQAGVIEPDTAETDSAAVSVPVPSPNNFAVSSPNALRNAVQIPVPSPVGTVNYGAQPAQLPYRATRPNEPINPEFLPNQAGGQSPDESRSRLVVPSGVNASDSLGRMRGTRVSPQLPPLAAVDQYLPRTIDEATPPPSTSSAAYAWPAKGVLTSGFGMRWGRPHKGIDIANAVGTPIYASADGVIEKSGWNNGGYGNLVDIRHPDGSMTRYGHNSKLLVRAGQQVRQGETIALMGSTGFSTGPHTHFEIHPAGKGAVNPVALLASRI
ncbi:peptidoglycan DD-metalloendopeptidase family protein [Fortiea contorta]|uniref:peptidoglycan DD-metalloendopeptidase family protein n=1 Tax=Fortiea contorta TaxID=1892405 RepID=UPI00034CB16B|nr:peptidoglycan DD-metalloendopeptidase family protein [Fortiea contorta]